MTITRSVKDARKGASGKAIYKSRKRGYDGLVLSATQMDHHDMNPNLPLVAITMGDPAGVGPEIIPKALCDPDVSRCCRAVVYGNADRLSAGAETTHSPIRFHGLSSIVDDDPTADAVPVIEPSNLDAPTPLWGEPTAANGAAMAAYLNRAIDDALAGRIAAIATAPINKLALNLAGIHFNGHTEILARRSGTQNYAMMLAGNRLRVVLATIHLPLRQVPEMLTIEKISDIIALTDQALKTRFSIQSPRIAVAGLNPHAGESGLFGEEESSVIRPAVYRASLKGVHVSGPHPPDTVFFRAAEGAYDAVVAMYHDQGLGPFKMIHFNDGINTTLGLPFVRTSVDHGTAYDIAGTGSASATSMKSAILMAAEQARWTDLHLARSLTPPSSPCPRGDR